MLVICFTCTLSTVSAQTLKEVNVPAGPKASLNKQFPQAKKITWEMEKGNYEANWGGKSGEDHSVLFSPDGSLIEIVDAIAVDSLPHDIITYINAHYKGSKISEAGKITNANGIHLFEAEVNGQDLIFDEKGKFLKKD